MVSVVPSVVQPKRSVQNFLEKKHIRTRLCHMSTDARRLALNYYRECGRDPEADLAALAANPAGVVVWLPRLVVLMKAADSRRPQDWYNLAESPEGADGWYVHLLAGDLSLARRLACEVPRCRWACFQRGLRGSSPHRLSWQRLCSPERKHN